MNKAKVLAFFIGVSLCVGFFVFASSVEADFPLINDEGLIDYYSFEGNSNDLKGLLNGSDTGIAYSSFEGKFGQYMRSAGAVGDGVNLGNDSSLDFTSGDFSFNFWINPTPSVDNLTIFARGLWQTDGYYCALKYISGAYDIEFVTNQGAPSPASQFTTGNSHFYAGEWTMVSVTRTGSVVKIYYNGVESGYSNQPAVVNPTSGSRNFYISRYFDTGYENNSKFDDFAIFNRVLTSADIESLYNNTFPTPTPTPTPTSTPTPPTTSTSAGDGGGGGGSASAPVCNDSKPGSAPTLLSASAGTNSVTLTWSKATNPVTKYLIAYGTTSEAMQYGNPSVGEANTTFYTVGSLLGGTTYYFKVKAINDCMPGDFSNVLSAVSTGAVITTIGPVEGFAPVSEIPGNLFDIALTIDSTVLGASSELIARTQFTSFGTVPTLVNMVYRIEDASGKEVFSENGEVTVETEKTVTKEFKSLTLGKGKYTLIISTTYGNDVQDEFRQAFEVKGASVAKIISSKIIGIISVTTVVGGYIIFLFIKRKRKKR